ncbi:hypothetical protein Stsp02_11930 [Streptomyces sp. NBRC 14336]|nr:hypothetical protein Stsp02_11930 [Streptomyces sp. NBRC 14336]
MGGAAARAGVGGSDTGAARDSRSGSGRKNQALRDTRHGEVLLGIDTNTRAGMPGAVSTRDAHGGCAAKGVICRRARLHRSDTLIRFRWIHTDAD